MRRSIPQCWVMVLAAAVVMQATAPVTAEELPKVSPAEVGMSAKKLAEADQRMQSLVEKKRLAGGIIAVARKGKLVHLKSFGMMDLEAEKPMRNDAIMRFYSMTKALTSAAIMMLVDDGKIDVEAPVSRYLPEFKDMKVMSEDGLVDTERDITVADLLRHTAGLTYGSSGNRELDRQFREAEILSPESTVAQMAEKLGKIPLAYQPGKGWQYSVSIDVLGRIVEVASGKSFDEFLQERLFKPLDMKDTGFYVPESKHDRFAQVYMSDGNGKLTPGSNEGSSDFSKPRKCLSGGGGCVSTARDYLRFLVMIQNGGTFEGNRLLSRKSVRLMTHNQLPDEVDWIAFGPNKRTGVGFGFGFSIRVEDSEWDSDGRIGEYGWGGMASTHYWVSPKDDLVVVVLEQTLPYSFLTEFELKGLIYDAIED